VVEDEPALLKLTERMLHRLGYHVTCARSPQEALELCQSGAIRFDLLLTDVILPGMNGRELRDELVKLSGTLPRIFMSGYTSDALASRGGVLDDHVHFLQKPFTRQALADRIRAVRESSPLEA
jgi:CheY-like chemotaxis protein